ncbi:PIG-L family deacetylase [Alicyclobacillus sp. TC]|uniref:N-acetylglucosaminyl deacetylase, LmbE family n=1 Tax=Alicyclobacillus tolerans TaxID=90970 RepID=A0A1M6RAE3_9BACL|nr:MULTISPECIES: PIG-L deacetylase family protein [Alicyclobacillus]QRF22382.1 PIG-L family deacetylase [Alicyclobacillus sp. TC]SHK29431.1 N-acetylglucosaminyl deacetylase, LmbE family [Alicyclobacillus montanus]
MNIRSIMNLPDLLEIRSLVCVEPHPDDNEVGAAGTLFQLAQNGCQIHFVTVTDGAAGTSNPDVAGTKLAHIRRKERLQAAKLLGVTESIFLNFPDAGTYQVDDLTAQLVDIFRKLQPQMVMTVDPWMAYEAHPDHIKTGKAVAEAVLFSSNPCYKPEAGEPFAVQQIAFYATNYPNTYVDITHVWENKLAALLTHKSQFDNEEWPLLSEYLRLEANEIYALKLKHDQQLVTNSTHGSPKNGLAEAFKVLSSRQLHFFPSALFS